MAQQERFYLIHQLEAHYGRLLAHAVISNHTSAIAMQDEPLRQPLTRKDFVKWNQYAYDIAEERERLIQASRTLSDDEFEIMVKWRTLPKWAEAMAELGYEWDMKRMKWLRNGEPVFPWT